MLNGNRLCFPKITFFFLLKINLFIQGTLLSYPTFLLTDWEFDKNKLQQTFPKSQESVRCLIYHFRRNSLGVRPKCFLNTRVKCWGYSKPRKSDVSEIVEPFSKSVCARCIMKRRMCEVADLPVSSRTRSPKQLGERKSSWAQYFTVGRPNVRWVPSS